MTNCHFDSDAKQLLNYPPELWMDRPLNLDGREIIIPQSNGGIHPTLSIRFVYLGQR